MSSSDVSVSWDALVRFCETHRLDLHSLCGEGRGRIIQIGDKPVVFTEFNRQHGTAKIEWLHFYDIMWRLTDSFSVHVDRGCFSFRIPSGKRDVEWDSLVYGKIDSEIERFLSQKFEVLATA